MSESPIRFLLNGQPQTWKGDPFRRLLDVLRIDLGLTGSKEGCGEGECGACAVLVDGTLVNACLLPMLQVRDRAVLTIEGVEHDALGARLQAAMAQAGATQCGICTPGMVIAALALLRTNPRPTREEVRRGLAGNLCRCTGYMKIIDGVIQAAEESS
ncbi:MAG: (2Fe-2S)-binding protein [Candidatus Cloacimonetes bacterium]|nr:(2Fe-2S)-binding protein [Candidatus Cloacimonadota bacterium]